MSYLTFFKQVLSVIGFFALTTVNEVDGTVCSYTRYSYYRYFRYYFYCYGSKVCCGSSCCSSSSSLAWYWWLSLFMLMVMVISVSFVIYLKCCKRPQSRSTVVSFTRRDPNVAVISSNNGVQQSGYVNHPYPPPAYPANGNAYYNPTYPQMMTSPDQPYPPGSTSAGGYTSPQFENTKTPLEGPRPFNVS
ncbi:uncharacterized protein [Ptychodera flava]|uniref:uncharacterized protein n=1 Tax=Ptychodera flava TaxID=63121 RepID=UPI00396A769C